MNALKMCLNWKVLAGLAGVAVALFALAPGLALAALPFLFLAACPLSMLFMAGGMGKMMAGRGNASDGAAGQYSCPMHPSVTSNEPGRCRECGMSLMPTTATEGSKPIVAAAATPERLEPHLARLRAELDNVNEQRSALARQISELETDATAASANTQPLGNTGSRA